MIIKAPFLIGVEKAAGVSITLATLLTNFQFSILVFTTNFLSPKTLH